MMLLLPPLSFHNPPHTPQNHALKGTIQVLLLPSRALCMPKCVSACSSGVNQKATKHVQIRHPTKIGFACLLSSTWAPTIVSLLVSCFLSLPCCSFIFCFPRVIFFFIVSSSHLTHIHGGTRSVLRLCLPSLTWACPVCVFILGIAYSLFTRLIYFRFFSISSAMSTYCSILHRS